MRDGKCFCQPMLDEFQKSKFSLEYDNPADFCRSQWQRKERSLIWVIYRWALAAFYAAGVLGSAITGFKAGTWFIYMTDWGFTLCLYTSVYGAVISTIHYKNPTYFGTGNRALKIYWASHFATAVLSLMVTIVYWSSLHPDDGEPVELFNIWEHALNSVGMFIDSFMVAFPSRLMHFVYPITVVVIFGFFSLFYYLAGGTDYFGNHFIYDILDWDRPGLAIGCICAVLALVLLLCVVNFWAFRLRLGIYVSCVKPQVQGQMEYSASSHTIMSGQVFQSQTSVKETRVEIRKH